MAYKAILNNSILFFDSSKQFDDILLTKAVVKIKANTAGSFNFTMAPTHKCYGQLNRLTDYIDVYRDNDIIFSGRVYSISDPMNGLQDVSCEGLLAMLSDSVYRPITYQGDLEGLVLSLIASHNSQVEGSKRYYLRRFTMPDTDVYREYVNYEQTITRLKDLQESFGGYITTRKNYDADHASIVDVNLVDVGIVDMGDQQIYLDWLKDFIDACDQPVELKSNLLDIKKTINASGIITGIVPIGAKLEDGTRVTIESVNYGSDLLLADSEYISQYGYIVKAVIWDDVHEPSILKTKASQYLAASLTERTEIKLTAVDLADAGYDIESFRVGQKVTVTSVPHGIEAMQFNCISQNLDLLNPAQNKLELGEVRVGYVESVKSDAEQIVVSISQDIARSETTLRAAIDQATALITGNEGGYVVFHDSNGDTYPDEILIMDTPSIDTAVKIWRWNSAGLGYSNHGYSGPYGLAITMDGGINADYVVAGTMLADRIRGGTLQLGGFNNRGGLMQVMTNYNTLAVQIDNDGILIPIDNNLGDAWDIKLNRSGFSILSDFGNLKTSMFMGAPGVYYPDQDHQWELKAETTDDSDITWWNGFSAGQLLVERGTLTPISFGNRFDRLSYTEINPGRIHTGLRIQDSDGFTVDTINGRIGWSFTKNGTTYGNYVCDKSTTSEYVHHFLGALQVSGGTKERVIDTDGYQDRSLYCYEMASPMFGDVGEGVIGDDGICYIMLDPIFSETIQTSQYQVFLQPYGDGRCWVSERNSSFFIVEGTPGMGFGWEMKAKQIDFSLLRLEPATRASDGNAVSAEPLMNGDPTDYFEDLTTHINDLKCGREAIIA